MLKRALVVGLGAVLIGGVAAPAMAAPKAGLNTSSVNGGDNGWGNCGHNSSGGMTPTGFLDGMPTPNNGNGGYKKNAVCKLTRWADDTPIWVDIVVDLTT